MSIKIMSQIWQDSNIKANKKLLFLALADFANDEGICYPSQDTLVKKCGLTKKTVIKYLKEFEEQKLLIQLKRNRKSGGRISSKYLLFPSENFKKLDENERSFFEPKCTGYTNTQSVQATPKKDTQSVQATPKPSPTLFNHHLYKQLGAKEKELFMEYLKLRTSMKLKNTYEIKDRLLRKLFEFGNHKEVIERAIVSNWKDFYPIRKNKTPSQNYDPLSIPGMDMSYDPVSVSL